MVVSKEFQGCGSCAVLRGCKWALIFGVIFPYFLVFSEVFAVKLANFLMFTVSEKNTVNVFIGNLRQPSEILFYVRIPVIYNALMEETVIVLDGTCQVLD